LKQLSANPARACRDPLEIAIWLNLVVDAVTVITKILSAKTYEELIKNLKDLGAIVAERRTEIDVG
jgi:hypothetical protein